jgi:RNA 3'-terminal phosphate cyclase (ATP)
MPDVLEIDASIGEGGGQVLRTSLALSVLLQKPVRITNIRSGRPRPGLQPQHLAGVHALAKICKGTVYGAKLGSTSLDFFPGLPAPARITVNIGTAGSTALLFAQLAPVGLLVPLNVRAFGGTDVAFSPPSSFVSAVWIPAIKSMGAKFDFDPLTPGYFPVGGGRTVFKSRPAHFPLKALSLLESGELKGLHIIVHGSGVPKDAARLALSHARKSLAPRFASIEITEEINLDRFAGRSKGLGVDIQAVFDSGATIASSALGDRGMLSESQISTAAKRLIEGIKSRAPMDIHLADQLLLYAVLAKGKSLFRVAGVSDHLATNAKIIRLFLPDCVIELPSQDAETKIVSVQGIAYTGISSPSH